MRDPLIRRKQLKVRERDVSRRKGKGVVWRHPTKCDLETSRGASKVGAWEHRLR